MKAILLVCLALLVARSISKCSDSLSCFKNKLFNFGSPGENIYSISSITNNNQDASLNVLAYGDFNNDLQYASIYSALISSRPTSPTMLSSISTYGTPSKPSLTSTKL